MMSETKNTRMGKLIVFSGIDGSGKTTAIKLVKPELESKNIPVEVFRNHEPGADYWNAMKMIKGNFQKNGITLPYEIDRFMQALELVMMCENRLPELLEKYKIVLSDRYIIDRVVYGELRGNMGIAKNALESILRKPDLTLFFQVSPQTAMKRIEQKGGPEDWKEQPEMLEKAAAQYQKILGNQQNTVIINAEQQIDRVVYDVLKALNPLL